MHGCRSWLLLGCNTCIFSVNVLIDGTFNISIDYWPAPPPCAWTEKPEVKPKPKTHQSELLKYFFIAALNLQCYIERIKIFST